MPRFVARLEATDGSGHYRRSVIEAATEEEARTILLAREQRFAGYRLTTDELAELKARQKTSEETGGKLAGIDRSKLALHEQAEPYELVYIGKGDPADGGKK